MTLGQVIVFAKDLAKMRAFYRDALELAVVDDGDGYTILDAGGVKLLLHAIPEPYAANIAIADPPAARSDTPIKLQFAAADVAAARDRLLAHGGFPRELDARSGSCDCLDPEGNVVRIASR